MGVGRDLLLVGHQDDGVPLAMDVVEQRHDFLSGLRIQVSGRLVGEHGTQGPYDLPAKRVIQARSPHTMWFSVAWIDLKNAPRSRLRSSSLSPAQTA
jgi:hypothetical protein